mgnify:CR=1 FL=1
MFCTKCGAKLPDDVRFCTACGNPVGAAPVAPVVPVPPVAESPVTPVYDPPVENTSVGETEVLGPVYEAPVEDTSAGETVVLSPEDAPAYAAPVYEAPVYEAPVAPVVEAPVAPVYEAPVAPVVEAPVMVAPAPVYAPAAAPQPAPAPNTPIAKLKKSCGSILVLVAIVLFTAMLALQVYNVFEYTDSTFGAAEDLVSSVTEDDFVEDILDAASDLCVLFGLLCLVPAMLMAGGMWTHFIASKCPRVTRTTGLTLVKAAMVIRLVGKFLVMALVLAALALLIMAGVSGDVYVVDELGLYWAVESTADMIFLIAGAAVALILLLLPILYDFFVLTVTNNMSKTLTTGELHLNGCGRLSVMNYVMVALQSLSLLGTIVATIVATSNIRDLAELLDVSKRDLEGLLSTGTEFTSILVQVLSIVTLILFALVLKNYKKSAKEE